MQEEQQNTLLLYREVFFQVSFCVITETTKLAPLVLYLYFKLDNILNVTSSGQLLSFVFFFHWTVVIFGSCGLCSQNNSLCSTGVRILKVICNLLDYFL